MNIVVAPDSFKGSLTAIQAAETMKRAIIEVNPKVQVIQFPMADGGEGTIDSFLYALDGERIAVECTGPLGEKIQTEYALIEEETAVIECANIAGLTQVPVDKRNPDHTTTYGMGEVIVDALNRQCKSIIIGLGGSATNDGGLGMLLALGMRAYNDRGEKVGTFGKDLRDVKKIDLTALDPRLKEVHLHIASDVDNPLYGKNGASKIYGPQKGMTEKQVEIYDAALKNYSQLLEHALKKDSLHQKEGAGAAGGLGFALLALGGKVISGAQFIAQKLSLEKSIQQADVVLTGEGQSDHQTLYGKAPGYIATLGKKYDIPVLLLSGGLKDVEQLNTLFTSCFSIVPGPISLEECMEKADSFLYELTKQVFQGLLNCNKKG